MFERLGAIKSSEYRGPRAGFSDAHVVKAIIEIGERNKLGRTRLASLLDLGQGEVRTLLKRLKENDLIEIVSDGCELSPLGKKNYREIANSVPWRSAVDGSSLGIGAHCWAIVVRGKTSKVLRGLEQRDAAIRMGATGALTVIYSAKKFKIPSEGADCEASGPSEPWNRIRKSEPRNNDVVIICGAEDPLTAEYGGWTAALTLLN